MPITRIPDLPSHTGFCLLWIVVGFVASLLCIALFFSGHWIFASIIILAVVVQYFRHGMSIARQRRMWWRFSNSSLRNRKES